MKTCVLMNFRQTFESNISFKNCDLYGNVIYWVTGLNYSKLISLYKKSDNSILHKTYSGLHKIQTSRTMTTSREFKL